MPARVVVVHDDASFLADLVDAMQRAGYEVAGFAETPAALTAIEATERVSLLVTRVAFPAGMPHGISLAHLARSRHRDLKVLFVSRPEMVQHADGIGEILIMPITAADVVAKVRELLPLSD